MGCRYDEVSVAMILTPCPYDPINGLQVRRGVRGVCGTGVVQEPHDHTDRRRPVRVGVILTWFPCLWCRTVHVHQQQRPHTIGMVDPDKPLCRTDSSVQCRAIQGCVSSAGLFKAACPVQGYSRLRVQCRAIQGCVSSFRVQRRCNCARACVRAFIRVVFTRRS